MQTLWLCNSHDYCRQCIFWKKLELSKGYQLSCREKQQEENSSLFHNPIWATRDMPEMCVWKGNDTSFKEPEIIWCMIIKHNIKIEKKKNLRVLWGKEKGTTLLLSALKFRRFSCLYFFIQCSVSLSIPYLCLLQSLSKVLVCLLTCLFMSVCSPVGITECFLTLFISVLLEWNWKLAKEC